MSVGWLHISDLHQGMTEQGWLWPNLHELFFDDLCRIHDKCGPWDLILFTGDLTLKGAKNEFLAANAALEDLMSHLHQLGSDPVLLPIPGNHDLQRPAQLKPEVRAFAAWDDDSELQAEFWGNPASPYRKTVDSAFANYQAWWAQWRKAHPSSGLAALQKGLLPGDFAASIVKEQTKVGVLGLNTAFLQLTGGEFLGKLGVGAQQFQSACGGDGPRWVREHDVCFLMTHHPPDWLTARARRVLLGEIASPGRFAAHLFGHMHEAVMTTWSTGGGRAWQRLQGSSLFGLEHWGQSKESRQHGYTAGRLSFGDSQAYLRLWPRLAVRRTSGHFALVPDYSFELEDDGGTRPAPIALRTPIRHELRPQTPGKRSLRLLCVYAREDESLAHQMRKHAAGLLRSETVNVIWRERRISPGSEWKPAADDLDANIVILMISSDFLGSAAGAKHVDSVLSQANANPEMRVIPVILRATDWQDTPLSKFQVLPTDGVPVTSWAAQDDAWVSVVRGLRTAIEYRWSPINATTNFAGGSPLPRAQRQVDIRNIGEIFRTTGQPDVTYVEPSQISDLKSYLAVMGQGLVIEGPSGIGKTTATKKAMQTLERHPSVVWIASRDPSDVSRLTPLLHEGLARQHLVVDDFHFLEPPLKKRLASAIKILADRDSRDAKITVIGINPIGASLVDDFPDLVGRFETVSMVRQPDSKIDELIAKGEASANVTFEHRSEFIQAAQGSFFTAQQLCFHAAMKAGFSQTQPSRKPIHCHPSEIVGRVVNSLRFKYYKPLADFAAFDADAPVRGACLVLLWLMSLEADFSVTLSDARRQYQALERGFDWLKAGNLEASFARIKQLPQIIYYNAKAEIISAEDPQLGFFLRNMKWKEFAKKTGNAVDLSSDGTLALKSDSRRTERSVQEVKGNVDFGIITIREDEFEAVLKRFAGYDRVSGRRFYNVSELDVGQGESYLVAVVRCIEQGNGEAQDAARDLIEDLAPRWILIVGIAGGVPSNEFTLGDVVVSTRILDFSVEASLEERASEFALTGGPMEKEVTNVAANLPAMRAELGLWNAANEIGVSRPEITLDAGLFYGDAAWRRRVKNSLAGQRDRGGPLVTAGAIASSDRLLKSSDLLAFWLKSARQVIAIEMESAGVYRAARGSRTPILAIRGLSDIVGYKREAAWTQYACHSAASFAHALLRTKPIKPRVSKLRFRPELT